MGDRCSFQIWVLKSDQEKFVQGEWCGVGEDSFGNGFDDSGWLEDMDANYAYDEDLTAAAKAGTTFYGSHGEGGNYPAQVFVCFKGELVYVVAPEGEPVAEVLASGRVKKKDLETARRYWALFRKAEKAIKKENDEGAWLEG